MDEELKDEGILIDGKEAKRQFLEELRSKNEEESRKEEEEKNNQNNEDEEEKKKQFLEEVRKNLEDKKVEGKKISEDDNLKIENKDIVDNNDDSKTEKSEGKVENDDQSSSEEISEDKVSEDKVSEENKEENVDTALVSSDNTENKGKNLLDGTAKASLIDTALTAVVSVFGVYIFDLILRIFGYYVVDFKGVYIILFLIILVLYPIIMHHSKQGKTLGQKIGKMEVKEREE
ncbi:RDD family protein [Clostridium thailandense]|uniref:RDD family protein n=1 Tax=Clostridium thailandense TaxID=2794346 RepID=UPI003988A8FF